IDFPRDEDHGGRRPGPSGDTAVRGGQRGQSAGDGKRPGEGRGWKARRTGRSRSENAGIGGEPLAHLPGTQGGQGVRSGGADPFTSAVNRSPASPRSPARGI